MTPVGTELLSQIIIILITIIINIKAANPCIAPAVCQAQLQVLYTLKTYWILSTTLQNAEAGHRSHFTDGTLRHTHVQYPSYQVVRLGWALNGELSLRYYTAQGRYCAYCQVHDGWGKRGLERLACPRSHSIKIWDGLLSPCFICLLILII